MDNSSAKVTIIVPIYNGESFIDRCIKSVLSQTYKDYILVLVNDGSTDNSGLICSEYASKYSNIIYISKENGGEGSARNAGLNVVKTEYVTFLDCDDELPMDALDIYLKSIRKTDMVVGGLYKREKNRVKTYNPEARTVSGTANIVDTIISDMYFINGICSKLYKSDILLKYGCKFNDFKYGEDTYFVYTYLKHVSSITFVNKPVYSVNVTAGSLSLSNVREPWKYMKEVYSLGKSLDPSNSYIRSQLLLRCIKTTLLLEARNGKLPFLRSCKDMELFVNEEKIICVKGKYNSLILRLLKKEKFIMLYRIIKGRILLSI